MSRTYVNKLNKNVMEKIGVTSKEQALEDAFSAKMEYEDGLMERWEYEEELAYIAEYSGISVKVLINN